MSPQTYEQAVSAAQAIMRLSRPDLYIDGRWGTFTQTAYNQASPDIKAKVDAVVRAVSNGSVEQLTQFRKAQEATIQASEKKGTHNWAAIFKAEVVPAAKRRAQQEGFAEPSLVVAQMSLESGGGSHVGAPYNWAGIKASRNEQTGGAVSTTEVVNGQRVTIKASFRAFNNVEEFIDAYFKILKKWPKVRDARTPAEYAAALKVSEQGGYATEKRHVYVAGLAGQQRKFA